MASATEALLALDPQWSKGDVFFFLLGKRRGGLAPRQLPLRPILEADAGPKVLENFLASQQGSQALGRFLMSGWRVGAQWPLWLMVRSALATISKGGHLGQFGTVWDSLGQFVDRFVKNC